MPSRLQSQEPTRSTAATCAPKLSYEVEERVRPHPSRHHRQLMDRPLWRPHTGVRRGGGCVLPSAERPLLVAHRRKRWRPHVDRACPHLLRGTLVTCCSKPRHQHIHRLSGAGEPVRIMRHLLFVNSGGRDARPKKPPKLAFNATDWVSCGNRSMRPPRGWHPL